MEQFIIELLEILECEQEVSASTYLADIEEWDSLSVVSFAAMADIKYGKKLTAEMIRKAQTVNDLYALVQESV